MNKEVKIGIDQSDPKRHRLGVALILDGSRAIIATDEARTLACDLDDSEPLVAKALRDRAGQVDDIILNGKLPSKPPPALPFITGAEALRRWTIRHRDILRSAYKAAGRAGADSVLWVMPSTESLDDEPAEIQCINRAEASDRLKRIGTKAPAPARHGFFTIIASKGDGRFRGTFEGQLSIAEEERPVPPAPPVVVVPPAATAN